MVNIKHSSIYFERHTLPLPGRIFGLPTNKEPRYKSTQVSHLDFVWTGAFKNSQETKSTATGRSKHSKGKGWKIAGRPEWSEGLQIKNHHKAGRSVSDQGNSYRDLPDTNVVVCRYPRNRHQSQPRSSSVSTRVHLEEYNPPYRGVHKVRRNKTGHTVWSTPSVSRSSWRQWRVGIAS